jgi:hypothetical protein
MQNTPGGPLNEGDWYYIMLVREFRFKLMRRGKGQGGKEKLTATENNQSEINGLAERSE